jgi:peptidoglycan/LPS O-acetylase OafA/YrhL
MDPTKRLVEYLGTSVAANHRRDIDGLRAIAVLAVVLFHLGFRFTPGGYVGVDVFFVISGYLITRQIDTEIGAGRFTLISFYERRVRRIAPALVVFLAGTALVAWRVLLPADLVDFGRSLVASIASVSNIYFWATRDYFTQGSSSALIHTWSLAVEEQFYLLFPLLLLVLRRRTRRMTLLVLAIVAVTSFAVSSATLSRHPQADFYLLPQRAWELMCGALLALIGVRGLRSYPVREAVAACGLMLIAIAVGRFSSITPFPGPMAALPCLGAVLILAAGEAGATITAGLLSLPPLAGVGLISYSVYLWHVPLIVLMPYSTRITYGHVLGRLLPMLSPAQAITVERILFLLTLSMLLGWLSWRFVEQPIRYGRLRPSGPKLFRMASVAALLLTVSGVATITAHGFPRRFSPSTLAIVTPPAIDYRYQTCLVADPEKLDRAQCLTVNPHKPNWIILGDSHGGQLYHGLHTVYPELNVMQYTLLDCKPMPSTHAGESGPCHDAMATFYADWLAQHPEVGVVLAANWQTYDVSRLGGAIDRLRTQGHHVVLIGPIMHYDMPLPQLLANGKDADVTAERHRLAWADALDAQMKAQAATTWHVPYFSYPDAFCALGRCRHWTGPLAPLQFDETHLTNAGSVMAAAAMRRDGLLSGQ